MACGYEQVKEREAARRFEIAERCRELFEGKAAGFTLEIGCGHGHFLTQYAEAFPKKYCIGVDLLGKRLERAQKKKETKELRNIDFLKAEAGEFLEELPGRVAIDEVFILFPDPWPKARHHRRRLIQPRFLSELAKRVRKGGVMYFRTDYEEYYEWVSDHVREHASWEIGENIAWPFECETLFQRKMASYKSLKVKCI